MFEICYNNLILRVTVITMYVYTYGILLKERCYRISRNLKGVQGVTYTIKLHILFLIGMCISLKER